MSPPARDGAAPVRSDPEPAIGGRAVSGALWSSVSSNGNLILAFLVFLLLARLLGPASFGLVAIATVFIDVTASLARGGLHEAIVQRRELSEECLDTAFWLSLANSAILCLLLVSVAGHAADLFAMPELEPVLQVLSLSFLISGFGTVHEALLTRGFGFKRLAMRNLGATTVAGTLAIAMALTGWGVWSLVAQRVVHALATTVLSWIALGWLPRLRFRRAEARDLVRFGGTMLGSNILLIANDRVHEVVAGLFLDAAAVGYLRIGGRCVELMVQVTLVPLLTIALPTFSRLQDEPGRLRDAYLHFVGAAAIVAFPAFVGFAVLASSLVPLVFGAQWTPAVGVAEILCLLIVPAVPNAFTWPALAAVNRPGWGLVVLATEMAVGAGLALAAVPFDLEAVAGSYVLRAFLVWPVVFAVLGRATGVSAGQIVGALARPLLGAAAMGLAVYGAQPILVENVGSLSALAVSVALGIALYLALAMLLMRDAIRPLLGQVASRFQHRLG